MTYARAARADGNGRIRIEDVVVTAPGPGEVLVRVEASGVCHTDHQILAEGFNGILGHEASGVVEAVGSGVSAFSAGDVVVSAWALSCGRCFQCLRHHENLCERYNPVIRGFGGEGHAEAERTTTAEGEPLIRAFHIGSLSSHTVVHEKALVALAPGISFEVACMLGCGVATGFCSVTNVAGVEAGSTVVVLGCGGVGLAVVQAAKLAGARRVIAVDLNSERLDLATRLGATDTLQPASDDSGLRRAATEVKHLLGGRAADYAFECTAVPALGAAPLAMVRNGGTAVQVSGIEEELTIDMRLFEWDKVYVNPLMGGCRPGVDLPRLMELYLNGDLELDALIARTFPLEEVDDAFEAMLRGAPGKCVVRMGPG